MPIPLEVIKYVECGDSAAVAAALRDDPSLVTAVTDDGDTLLHFACWQKQSAVVKMLLRFDPDIDARGCYGRTPLHYAVHEGGPESAAIVGVLLARGADPSLLDENGFSVEGWARIEMTAGLDDLLGVLREPARLAATARAFEQQAERESGEPPEVDLKLTIGEAPTCITIAVGTGRSQDTGRRGVVVSVTIVAPRGGGGMIASTFYPALGAAELDRFRAGLVAIRSGRAGTITLDGLASAGRALDVYADIAGTHARWSSVPFGPPGEIESPLVFTADLDAPAIDSLVDGCAAASAALAAWSQGHE